LRSEVTSRACSNYCDFISWQLSPNFTIHFFNTGGDERI
jgi:hypothetical protein